MQDDQTASGLSDDFAVARLFEMSCNGDTQNKEFWELDSMVQQRLLQAYGVPGALDFVSQTSD
jgi:hypothetical protein